MLPSSVEVEGLIARVRKQGATLQKLRASQAIKPHVKSDLAMAARDWLRFSSLIREAGICDTAKLDAYDEDMRQVLAATQVQARASALRKKLKPFLDGASTAVVVPLIQHAGSPRQVLSRQVQGAFSGTLTADEAPYIDEAARCVTVQAHRAAIIMLWAAGVARLHAAIERVGFNTFNNAVDATLTKKGKGHPFSIITANSKVGSQAELQRSKDAELLVVGIDLFRYDLQIYQELARLLSQRNDAAHPGMGNQRGLTCSSSLRN